MSQIQHQLDSLPSNRDDNQLSPPVMHRVFLINDDVTTMEFVVMILQRYFNKSHDDAVEIMLKIHHEGRGECGVYPKDIALTRVHQVIQHARREGFPLMCTSERV